MQFRAAAARRDFPAAGMRLPWGVTFQPTDVELMHYLWSRVVAGSPLPAGVPVGSCDLYAPDADPWRVRHQLASPYVRGSTFYCFTARTHRRGSRGVLRGAGSGAWVAKGRDVPVKDPATGEVLGRRLTLNFVPKAKGGGHSGCPESSGHNWVMHEYRLIPGDDNGGGGPRRKDSQQDVVVCKVYQKQRKAAAAAEEDGDDDFEDEL